MVGFCTRHPWPVVVIAAVLAMGPALYTAIHFAVSPDPVQLLPKDLPWPQHELAYRELDDLFAGRFPSFSWRVLMNGKPAAPDEPRGLIEIKPKLDFSALEL